MALRGMRDLDGIYGTYEEWAIRGRAPGRTSGSTFGRVRAAMHRMRRWLATLHSDDIRRVASQGPGASSARPLAEQRAFEQLFARYYPPLLDYLYGMTRDHAVAEDLVQETFLRAYGAPTVLSQVTHPQAWLYRIATNVALDTTRRQRRFHWLPLGHVEPEAGSGNSGPWAAPRPPALPQDDISATIAERDAVWSVLAELPPRWRAVLLLQTTAGFAVRDIAALLQLKESTIRKMLYRAKERFRALYTELEAAEAESETQGGQR